MSSLLSLSLISIGVINALLVSCGSPLLCGSSFSSTRASFTAALAFRLLLAFAVLTVRSEAEEPAARAATATFGFGLPGGARCAAAAADFAIDDAGVRFAVFAGAARVGAFFPVCVVCAVGFAFGRGFGFAAAFLGGITKRRGKVK